MKVWTFTHLWTGEGEFPRIEEFVFDSLEKALTKAKQNLDNSQKLDPDFWKHEDITIKGNLENKNYFEILQYEKDSYYFALGICVFIDITGPGKHFSQWRMVL